MQTVTTQLLLPVLKALCAGIAALVLASARRWIAAHAKNAAEEGILNRIADAVSTVVAQIEQTIVGELKNGTRTSLSKEQGETVLNLALAGLKSHLGKKGLDEVVKILKPDDLDGLLVGKIEAEVNATRSLQAMGGAAAMATQPAP